MAFNLKVNRLQLGLYKSSNHLQKLINNKYFCSQTFCHNKKVNLNTGLNNLNSHQFSTTSRVSFGVNRNQESDGARFKMVKFVGVFSAGVLAYLAYSMKSKQPDHLKTDSDRSNNEETIELDEKFNIDLNEVYEKCAVVFLSNPKVNLKFNIYCNKFFPINCINYV